MKLFTESNPGLVAFHEYTTSGQETDQVRSNKKKQPQLPD